MSMTEESPPKFAGGLERSLAFVGAAISIVIPLLFVPGQQPLFPMPGLYFIEIGLLGLLSLTGILTQSPRPALWGRVSWAAAGALFSFVVLGAWTIGLFLAPAALAFILANLLADRRRGESSVWGLTTFGLAALLQAVIILVLVSFV